MCETMEQLKHALIATAKQMKRKNGKHFVAFFVLRHTMDDEKSAHPRNREYGTDGAKRNTNEWNTKADPWHTKPKIIVIVAFDNGKTWKSLRKSNAECEMQLRHVYLLYTSSRGDQEWRRERERAETRMHGE